MRDRLQSDKCARVLRALADPERLRIVQCLQSGPRTVTCISELLGNEIANVSHHLGVLRNAGLVLDAREGKFVVYSLHPDVFRPGQSRSDGDVIDLGCCRLELND
jgi:ArsR family transcriptional regulator